MALGSLPRGFDVAALVLNSLPQDFLAEMCQDVLAFLQCKIGAVDITRLRKRLEGNGIEETRESIQNAVNALTFVYRLAAEKEVNPDALATYLAKNSSCSETTRTVIKHLWAEEGKKVSSSDAIKQLLNVGELIDMKWKLGVAMSSSNCKSLNSPYVSMILTIADASGKIKNHSFELTVPEFQNFSRQMKEMSAIMETV
ncbi:COMM domain-containing protein 6-like [Oscarella lobularis]|uniref:COMM domain-containing protein 6-like n=1 Tax=Oscarella lobularis TaxID=121494 RepID=UPI00331412F2